MLKKSLTLKLLKSEIKNYIRNISNSSIEPLYGVNDGKAIGTYVEHDLQSYLAKNYSYKVGSSAEGIDLPSLNTDIKVTSIRQPQSSCPFKNATQKIYGLGYNLLVLVYEKKDDHVTKTARMNFLYAIFIDSKSTADYQTTKGLIEILDREGNSDDVIAFLSERNLPLDDIGMADLAKKILRSRPSMSYLTISNALQWRLQYTRAIELSKKGETNGIESVC